MHLNLYKMQAPQTCLDVFNDFFPRDIFACNENICRSTRKINDRSSTASSIKHMFVADQCNQWLNANNSSEKEKRWQMLNREGEKLRNSVQDLELCRYQSIIKQTNIDIRLSDL